MRKIIVAGFALAVWSVMPAPSQAAPSAQPGVTAKSGAGSGLTLVAGGCGQGRYRAANGYCYRRRPPPPPPPRYRRPCPPGYHPTPYGCRPNF